VSDSSGFDWLREGSNFEIAGEPFGRPKAGELFKGKFFATGLLSLRTFFECNLCKRVAGF